MFMRKFRKNFKGDSLIEVITAFAIVSIVGLITISGVVTSGRIKVQTNHIKNASYKADENLQKQPFTDSLSSDSIKIYSAADYDISTKSANTGSSPINTEKAIRCKNSGTDGGKTLDYKYYEIYESNPADTSGKGNFGMSGQWFIRFYLDPTVKMPERFYVVLKLSDGLAGASGIIDANKTSCTAGGVEYFYNQEGNTKGMNWFYGANAGEYIRTSNDGLCVKDSSGGIKKYDGQKVSFDKDGNLSFAWKYDMTPTENMKNNAITARTDFQIFDVAFYWSSLTAYGISLHIIDADTDKECAAEGGSSVMDRFTVYARDFGLGIASGVYDHTKDTTKNWFTPSGKSPYNFTSEDIQCGYNDDKGNWFLNKDTDGNTIPKINDTAYSQMGKQENGHNAIYNFDNIDYIYQWTKGHGGSETTEIWEKGFSDVNKRYMLSLGEFGVGKSENSFADSTTKFKEYLRMNSDQYYNDFLKWQSDLGFSTNFEDMSNNVETKFYYTYWVYYVLEVEKIRTAPNAALGDASNTEIRPDVNNYEDYTFKRVEGQEDSMNRHDLEFWETNGSYADEIAKLFYWYKYDNEFFRKVKSFLDAKNIQISDQSGDLFSYIDAISRYYWLDHMDGTMTYSYNYNNGIYDHSSSSFYSLVYDKLNEYYSYYFAWNFKTNSFYLKCVDVYDYFVNKDQISQRETNYTNFKKDCTYTNEQITHLDEAFKTIKSMVESDAVNYANYSEDYLVKEMIMYVYNKTYYDNFLEDMRKATVEMSSNTRFDKKAYKDNFPQKWDAYSQSVLNSQ